MSEPELRDVGPMARFEEMIADEHCMETIAQRLTDAENPETLEDIARSRKVPYGRLSAWITESRERTERYANAMRVRAELLAQQTIALADGVGITKGEIGKAKLQIDTRFKYAGHLKPEVYGNAANVNVSLTDKRTPTDRDAMVLEAARGVAFLLHQGARIRDRQAATPLLAAPEPKDVTPVKEQKAGPI